MFIPITKKMVFLNEIILVYLLFLQVLFSSAYEECTNNNNGTTTLICPTGNTCCIFGCIPKDLGSLNATCCSDNTGCAVGYVCNNISTDGQQFCVAGPGISDPLVQRLPRYRLCQTDKIKDVHGLPVNNDEDMRFLYYSSHGDLLLKEKQNHSSIRMVLVVIHGALRNADDYFCSATSIVPLQPPKKEEEVLILAPRFPVASDPDINYQGSGTPLLWQDAGSGPWRYGANAINGNVSSFAAMDRLLSILLNATQFSHLERITMIGHSSGGQFVQRYSLVTNTWDRRIRAIVANPSSYAYLFPLRFVKHEWRIPAHHDCPHYNQWKWGLDMNNDDDTVPYVQKVVQELDTATLLKRFSMRQLMYLAGSRDICDVSDNNENEGWCDSHGLEIECGDMLQGRNRWERHVHYLLSLDRLGIEYRDVIVPGVGHDHSLLFTSPEGLKAIFEPWDDYCYSQSSISVS